MHTFAGLLISGFNFTESDDTEFEWGSGNNKYSVTAEVHGEDALVIINVSKDNKKMAEIKETPEGWYWSIYDPRVGGWVTEGFLNESKGPTFCNDRACRIEQFRHQWDAIAPGITNALIAFTEHYSVEE